MALAQEVADRGGMIKGRISVWGEEAARILFPPACPGCRRIVSAPGTLCGRCWPHLRMIEHPVCPVYGTPFPHDMGEGFLSAEAIANPPPFARCRSAAAYEGTARRLVQALKYNDRTDLARWMAGWMHRAGHDLICDADVIVPVPLHPGAQRYFDKSAASLTPLEAARMAAALPLPKERSVKNPRGWLARHGNTISARIGAVGRDGLDSCVYR